MFNTMRPWPESTPYLPNQQTWPQFTRGPATPGAPPSPSPNASHDFRMLQMDMNNSEITTETNEDLTMEYEDPQATQEQSPPQHNLPHTPEPYREGLEEEDNFTNHFHTSLEDRMAAAVTTGIIPITGLRLHRNPLDKYTLGPMPTVHIAHPTAVLDLIDLKTIEMWVKYKPEKLLAIPFDSVVDNKNQRNMIAGKIFAAITEITGSRELSVATPEPNDEAKNTNNMPVTFLVYNLTTTQQKLLLERQVWSSTSITFRTTPLDLIRPNFLFAIKDLFTRDEEVYKLVQEVWQDDETEMFTGSLIEDVPERFKGQARAAIKTFLDSMTVERLDIMGSGNALKPEYNIYANGSALPTDTQWSRLRDYLAKREYSAMCGTGEVVTSPHKCTICYGVDHPRGLCQFPEKKGWNGPRRNPAHGRGRGGRFGGRYLRTG
jgi:hypothetical protein